jgi:uncharacterized damage-inducible protein DinB
MSSISEAKQATQTIVITTEALLDHWQGHRRLTRKLIEAFPEDKLFSYSVGGMRPFSAMVLEFLDMAVPGLNGVISGKWQKADDISHRSGKNMPATKKELLQRWDEATEQINKLWPQIPAHRFLEKDKAFGQWEGPGYFFIFYWIDNEIHHRGQAYVYLRSLGIEPPAFWDRS